MAAQDNEPVQGRTRFQKMVFLLQQRMNPEEEGFRQYDYEAYDYGPFSKDLYADLDGLIEQGYVDENTEEFDENKILYEYKLTEKGQNMVNRLEPEKRFEEVFNLSYEMKSEFNNRPLSEVIDYVYSEYPEYAENSVLG